MIQKLTDEEWVEHAEKQVNDVAHAFKMVQHQWPDVPIDALERVLWMVNGQNWICGSDMARAKVKAKQ